MKNVEDDKHGIKKLDKSPTNNISRVIGVIVVAIVTLSLIIYGMLFHGSSHSDDLIPINTTSLTRITKDPLKEWIGSEITDPKLKYTVYLDRDYNNPIILPDPEKIVRRKGGFSTMEFKLNDDQGVSTAQIKITRHKK